MRSLNACFIHNLNFSLMLFQQQVEEIRKMSDSIFLLSKSCQRYKHQWADLLLNWSSLKWLWLNEIIYKRFLTIIRGTEHMDFLGHVVREGEKVNHFMRKLLELRIKMGCFKLLCLPDLHPIPVGLMKKKYLKNLLLQM